MSQLKLLFFANFKETLKCAELTYQFDEPLSVSELCAVLAQKQGAWQAVFANPTATLKVAINQQMAEMPSSLHDGDEVAFFPPVTGG